MHAPRTAGASRLPAPAVAPLVALALSLSACGGDVAPGGAAAPPPELRRLEIVEGDAQRGEAGTELPVDLAVRLVGGRGLPLAGLRVHFSTPSGGTLDPQDATTDAAGIARSSWTLGGAPGESTVLAQAAGGASVEFRGSAIAPVGREPIPLAIATYEGSGQVVHPDVVRVPRRWGMGRRYLAITPYFAGSSVWERPSVFTAGDLSTWQIPPAARNPVAEPTSGYLSDPDMVFEPDARELWLYYRAVDGGNAIFLKRSADGVRWSDPMLVARAPSHRLVSPAVVRTTSGEWHMWSVDAGADGCSAARTVVEHRTSTDGLTWSEPRPVSLGDAELSAWHIDVTWIPERREYWALFNAKPRGSCSTPALYLATSTDGERWTTHPTPVLERGVISQFDDIVYRSTLEYSADADEVTIWYSGARYGETGWVWSAAVERLRRADLFRIVMRAASRHPRASADAPPLRDAP